MTHAPSAADRIGTELAAELLQDGRHALLAFLARAEDGGEAVELGTWIITSTGKLVRAARPCLVFPVGEVDRVRAEIEGAAATLSPPRSGQDGTTAPACAQGDALTASIVGGPDGVAWATLSAADGRELVAVPAAAIASLVDVLAEVERVLAELGRVPFPRAPAERR